MTNKPQVLYVGTEKYLLFDDALTEQKKGFKLTMNPAIRTEEPVLMPDQPWESAGIIGDSNITVMEDEGLYKLWYVAALIPEPGQGQCHSNKLSIARTKGMDKKTMLDYFARVQYMLCYATSRDGIHWEKPNLGLFDFEGSKENNIQLVARLGCTIFKDPTARPDKRYKLIYGDGRGVPHIHLDKDIPPYPGYPLIYGAYSSDGIHWNRYKKPIIHWYTDTTNVCYWDDRIKKYVAYVRWNENMTYKDGKTYLKGTKGIIRAIGRTESNDFRRFPTPGKIDEPVPDERTPNWKRLELYNSSAVKYQYAADSYFIFPSYMYKHPAVLETLDIHLGTSRDGINYSRWREPFVTLGQPGAFDSTCAYMGTGIIRKGGEMNMYYLGASYRHDIHVWPEKSGGIGRLRIRLDGFVSQDVPWSGGSLVTVPIKFDGDRLELNMDANAGGFLKVEVLTKAGKPIPGYTKQDADWLWGNDVRKTVTWESKSDISSLKGKTIRLNFIGRGVKLYAFQFVDKK